MPVPNLNNVATQNTFVDALTVIFPRGRPSFAVNVSNAGVYYTVAIISTSAREPSWENLEHFLLPSLNTFRDPVAEGFPPGSPFSGIKFRSAVAGVPARVTVM